MDDSAGELAQGLRNADLETAADRAALSAILEARGRHHEARDALHHAVLLLEDALGRNHYEVGMILERLAALLARAGDRGEAAALYDRALTIFERTLGAAHPRAVACRASRNEARAGREKEGHGG